MNINNINVILLKDFKKEFFDITPSIYLKFAPVVPIGKGKYKKIDPTRQDTLCYIKHKTKDLWAYDEKNKITFKPLILNKTGFTKYKKPAIFWLEYLNHPTFVIYKPLSVNYKNILFLNYKEKNDDIILEWKKYYNDATIFIYNEIIRKDLINKNVFAKEN